MAPGQLTFSPDSQHLAYLAEKRPSMYAPNLHYVVVDGKPEGRYEDLFYAPDLES